MNERDHQDRLPKQSLQHGLEELGSSFPPLSRGHVVHGFTTTFTGQFRIDVQDEPVRHFEHVEAVPGYEHQLTMGGRGLLTSRHGVRCLKQDVVVGSALLVSGGGPSAVHVRSVAVVDGTCFVAVGPYIVALAIPDLSVVWCREVDSATCFGIHVTADRGSLISHGELEVSRLTLSGDILWQAGGADVFSGGLVVSVTSVEVRDFNERRYVFDLETGT